MAPSGRPGAALEHFGQRESLGRAGRALRGPAARLVEQRHRQRAPFHHQLGLDRVGRAAASSGSCRTSTPGVDEKPAIAVFGQAGQPVDAATRRCPPIAAARSANRPATARACGTASSPRWRRPRPRPGCRQVSPRSTPAEPDAARPDRPEMLQQRGQDRRRAARRSRLARPDGRTGRRAAAHRLARILGVAATVSPSRLQQRGAAIEPHQLIVGADLEACRQRLGGQRRQRPASARSAVPGTSRERARREHVEACDRQALGAREALAAALAIAPVRPRAGIEQHADDGEVEGRPRLGSVRRPGRARASVAQRSKPPAANCRQREWRGMSSVG